MASKGIDADKMAKKIQRQMLKKISENATPKILTRSDLKELANIYIKEMKASIAKGISPIQGYARFPKYKNPKKYPGGRKSAIKKRYPGKRARPVNLFLSGKFLRELDFRVQRRGAELKIGFFKKYGKTLERGHRLGVNGQPKRPIIPNRNEDFTKRIKKVCTELYAKLLIKRLAKKR